MNEGRQNGRPRRRRRPNLHRNVLSPRTALLVLIAACNLFLVHATIVFLLVSPPYTATEGVLLWGSGFVGLVLLVYGGIVAWSTLGRLRETEDRLTELGSRLDAIVQGSPLPIIAVDRLDRIRLWNPAAQRLFGWDQEEALGQALTSVVDDDGVWEGIARAVVADRTVRDAQARWSGRDADAIDVGISAAPVRDAHGRIEGAVAVVVDLSHRRQVEAERKRLEEQLQQAQKMEAVGRLASGVAHDFNNILTAIRGNAELLLAGEVDPAEARGDVEEIRDATVRAAALTRQLLAFSRQGIVRPRPLDLNQLVRDLERLLRRVIGEAVFLETDLQTGLGTVSADPGQLEQVLMNLVVNARDAMPGGGTILVRTANARLGAAEAEAHPCPLHAGDYVVLSVTDTGTGIDPETAKRIFDPFFTTKPAGVGTGLGLSTAYGIVKQARGYIWVDSDPGLGSTFLVYLPRVEALPEPVETPPAMPVGSAAGAGVAAGTETILVVEDEEAVLGLARKVLGRSGYDVLAATRGTQAIRIAREHPGEIHLLFCDAVMPDLSGREVIERISRLRPGIPVLLTSGYAEALIERDGVLDRGTGFLPKPYTPMELAGRVRSSLAGRT